uniref:Transient receptor potential cation channel subfamily M member 4 n=1 Tax=Scleropages formosus TaxID=113540 RepID=A0A8C9SF99_SCLFO
MSSSVESQCVPHPIPSHPLSSHPLPSPPLPSIGKAMVAPGLPLQRRCVSLQSWIPKIIKKRVCTSFVEEPSSNGTTCQCGGPQDLHGPVATGDCFGAAVVSQWESAQHSSEYPTDAYGELEFAGAGRRSSHFLRMSCDTPPQVIYSLLTTHWNVPPPNLVVSVVGGEGCEKVKTWVREVLRQGLVKAAQSTGAWILTSGLREGVARCVGEAVRDHATAAPSLSRNKVIALGVAPWGIVHNRQQLVNPQGSFPAKYYVQNTVQDSCYLDNNYQAFLLVDDGTVGRRGADSRFRAKLEDHISHQKTGSGSIEIPVLCMLISGEASMLERMDLSLRTAIPWMLLAGSGGVADFICDVLGALVSMSPASALLEDESDGTGVELREVVLSIYQNRDLITVFSGEQEGPDDFDTVLLKALVRASKRVSSDASEYTEELKLAVAWNRVDIAKTELFNGDIQWKYDDLKDSMTDALVNDKPQFVRLFTENGLNILEYLTYGRLETLYRSLSDSSLIYTLLQRHLSERLSVSSSAPSVSQVLLDLAGDMCQPFYYHVLDVELGVSTRKSMKHVNKLLLGECSYRSRRCRSPWVSLFIWAVLQNRPEMAVYFWEMAGESVLSALCGCYLLRELSKLESETETKLSMKELAQKFENLAHDVFSECYQSSESRSFKLLIKKSVMWGGATCLQMAISADARLFFSHDGVQSLLSQIWWGDMERNTEVWKLVVTFFVPPLVYTSLIAFRAEKVSHKKDKSHRSSVKRPFVVTRWRRFWFAPVTSFLGNVLMYFLFLVLFAYILLIDFRPPPPKGPAPLELVLYFWVFTLVCEELRQTLFLGNATVVQSMRMYIQDMWNKFDLTAIVLFILGLCCRMFRSSYEFGRAVMCLDYMVFTLRLIHIFAVHKQLGPKIIIVGKMMKDIFFFLFFLGVWLVAYGVANQALLYTYDSRPDWVLRRVFYRPYLHIFGQIPLEDIDGISLYEQNCTHNTTLIEMGSEPCVNPYANWLVIVLLVVCLLVTNILLLNLLIAMFSYTFSKVQEHSDIYWKFQRYNLIAEYHSRPSLAPPFILLSHINLLVKRYIRKVPSRKIQHFGEQEQDRLMTWEAVQKENFLVARNKRHRESDSERLKRTSSKVDSVLKQMAEVRDHDRRLRQMESELEYCSSALSWLVEALSQSNLMRSTRPPPLPARSLLTTAAVQHDPRTHHD